MMNRLYTYYPEFDEEDFLLWKVREIATDQVIADFVFEEDAQEYMDFLEDGGAFAGFTPAFMTRKTPVNMNINDAFAAEFMG